MLITVLAFIIILSVLVIVHELGHFFVAKKLGIKVEEFGVGFPPRAFSRKIGETVYSINWLPVGGFVKLYGEDAAGGGAVRSQKSEAKSQNSVDEVERAYYARPLWQRMAVVTAGVIMNVILAIVLISFLFGTQGVPLPTDTIIVTEVSPGSPAAIAGILKNDRIIKIDGKQIKTTELFITETKKLRGQEVTLIVKRGDSEFTTKLTPRLNAPKNQGAMGVAISNIEVKKYAWYEAPIFGTIEAAKFSWMIASGLGSMITDFVLHGTKPQGVAGPIGVAQLTGEAVRAGWFAVLWFMALLSLNLAVLNILPIPALDGGRFFFMIIEMLTGKKVSPKYEAYAHGVGLVLLLGLMAVVTILDIVRLLQGKSIIP
jgi:regulator of sigma E protease